MPNARGLEHVASGTFSGMALQLDAESHGTQATAVTVVNLTMIDNIPRPLTLTFHGPGTSGYPPYAGHASALLEWGSAGGSASAVVDGRNGDQIVLTCTSLRVSIFNEAIAQGYTNSPAYRLNGVLLPIDFGAFVSLGSAVNKGLPKRTNARVIQILPTIAYAFEIPAFATRVKFYRNPVGCDFIISQRNDNAYVDALTEAICSTSIAVPSGADCPLIELAGDTKNIVIVNGATPMVKQLLIWELAL